MLAGEGDWSRLLLDPLKLFSKFGIIALELLHSAILCVSCWRAGIPFPSEHTYVVAFSFFALMISLRAIET